MWRRSLERCRQALPPAAVASMRAELLSSPLLSASPLAGTFRRSRGFGAMFTAEGRDELEHRLPAVKPFLSLALAPKAAPSLLSWRERRRGVPSLACNAFFLNVLVLSDGAGIGRHLDGTLRRAAEDDSALPRKVSVLYLTGGAGQGKLRIWRGPWCVASVRPEEGTLVHFRGELDHDVLAGTTGVLRVSLVCEQYALAPPSLSRLAPLQLQSKAGFAAHLADHQASGRARAFEVD